MARRKRISLFDDLADLAGRLHWGVGLLLAVIAYFFFHHFASQPPTAVTASNVNQVGPLMRETFIRAGSMALQYAVPIAFLAGALVSAMRRRRQSELHLQVSADSSPNALEKMSWQEFEGLVAESFRQKGYRVMEQGGEGPDGGVDLVAYMGKDKYLVQCKQWKTRQVGVAIVRELYGVMTAARAVGGFVVASGEFTPDAKEFAMGRSIELIDSRKLRRMIGGVQPVAAKKPETTAAPLCPKCESTMVQRTAKSGSNAGNQFWGCSRFPSCKGIRN